jgi:CBS domain-containing protein
MWLGLIGLFVYAAAQASYRQVLIREGLRGIPVRRIMTTDPITVPPGISVAQLIDDYIYRYHRKMFPVVENGRLIGCVSMNDIKAVPRDRWGVTPVAKIMQPCSAATAISPDTDTMELLSTMTRTQNGRFLVMEGDRLVGVVTLKDMLKFLSLKLDLEESERVDRRFAEVRAQERGLSPAGLAARFTIAANRRSGTSAPSARTGGSSDSGR